MYKLIWDKQEYLIFVIPIKLRKMIDLTGFISITGQPGLYKIIAQSKNGIIVEGLTDKKRLNVYASSKVSTLTDISMFTTGDDKPLNEIITAIFEKEKGGAAIDNKADRSEERRVGKECRSRWSP